MAKAFRAFVSGVVQGVFFRANTQAHANELGLKGWVRNIDDGRVEVFACGEEAVLQKMIDWLQHGPANARVDEVAVTWVEAEQDYSDFVVL